MIKIEINIFQKILIAIIIGLVLVIFVGTILSFTNIHQQNKTELLQKGKAISLQPPVDTSNISYFKLNRIRIITKNENSNDSDLGTVLVISPYLAYPTNDSVFFEELSRKNGIIKGIIQQYFQERTKKQLLSETEDVIKNILLCEINSQLSLGQISEIYFTDYIFLE